MSLVTLLIALAWLAFRGYQVRAALLEARAGLTQAVSGAGSGKIDAFVLAQRRASAEVRTARGAVQDPLWRLAAAVPVAGRSFAAVTDTTTVVGHVVDAVLPPLLVGATELQKGQLLTDGRVDLPCSRRSLRTSAGRSWPRRTPSALPARSPSDTCRRPWPRPGAT